MNRKRYPSGELSSTSILPPPDDDYGGSVIETGNAGRGKPYKP